MGRHGPLVGTRPIYALFPFQPARLPGRQSTLGPRLPAVRSPCPGGWAPMACAWRASGPSGNAWGTTRFVPRDSIDVIMAHPVARSESGDLRAGTSPVRPSARLPICPSAHLARIAAPAACRRMLGDTACRFRLARLVAQHALAPYAIYPIWIGAAKTPMTSRRVWRFLGPWARRRQGRHDIARHLARHSFECE